MGCKFSTVYADPPWSYSNKAARGAADNHYPTLDLPTICREPVQQLVANNAHLHLWTTNGFLYEAFSVIEAWGFTYKSCLVWVKPQLGAGNYWRVSHEFCLFAMRGSLPFADNTIRSWLVHRRTRHSRKPFAVRALIERVSPGPYLELYGREEQPNTGWTVYGNQVERRLF
jgi:N6-adenosine-specific RNA methylase IME4